MVAIIGPSAVQWFHGIDAILELFSFFIAMIIAWQGYKAYRLTQERKYAMFGGAFFLLGLSFAARMGAEALIYLEQLREYKEAVLQSESVSTTFFGARFLYILVVFLAYVLLTGVSMKLKNRPVMALIFSLLVILATIAHTSPTSVLFHIVNTLLIGFITGHFLFNYLERRTVTSGLIASAFLMILVESALMVAGNYNPYLSIVAYGFRFLGYVLLLSAFIRVTRA